MIALADNWKDYAVVATGDGYKLERGKDVVLLRPDPQVIWSAQRDLFSYPGLCAVYRRNKGSGGGGGVLEYKKGVPPEWDISSRALPFRAPPMNF